MIEKIQNLANEIGLLTGTRVEVSAFPSGAASLHVVRDNRLFILDYSPTRRFGVDEVHNDDSFLISYRFTSEEFEPAAVELLSIVGNAVQIAPILNGVAADPPIPAET